MKYFFLAFIFGSFASSGFAQNNLREMQIAVELGTKNIQVDCDSVSDFAKGKYDNDNKILGVDRDNWNGYTKSEVISVTDKCIEQSTEGLVLRGKYTKESAAYLTSLARIIDAKAASIVERNEARRIEEIKRGQEFEREKTQRISQRKAERQKQLEQCEESPAYKLHSTTESLVANQMTIKYIQEQVARERKISQASGVRNLTKDYANGRDLVDLQATIKADWANYKKLGGKAASPKAVSLTTDNPCENFRESTAQ